MSSIKLKHSSGNGVSLAGPETNPAADRIIRLNDNYAGDGSIVTANSSGNVGIGTSSPDSKLHVAGDSGSGQLRLTRSNAASNGNDYGRIYFESTNDVLTGQIAVARESAENDGYMHFKTASGGSLAEGLRIDSAGRVTKPNNPRFCVIGGSNMYNNTESDVWDGNNFAPQSGVNGGNSVHVNVGSHYTVGTGRWTVPVAGTYYLFFYGSTGSTHSHFVYISKNGSGVNGDLGLEYDDSLKNVAGSVMTTCAANDYFNFCRRGSSYRFYNLVWGGWLIG